MTLVSLLPLILLALGVGFFIANVRLALELWHWRQRRPDGLVTWPARRPPYFGLSLGLGMVLGLLVLLKAYLTWRQSAQLLLSLQLLAQSTGGLQVYPILPNATQLLFWLLTFALSAFGELMMFVYFGYMLPLTQRINRGLYRNGIWTDSGFLTYQQIGGIAWRDGAVSPTLLIISRVRALARRLEVPATSLGEVRRVLRDQISSHAIEIDDGPGLHLGSRDARDSV
jgi:hypothetical protein